MTVIERALERPLERSLPRSSVERAAAAPAYTGPLDLVPGAVVAYGVRALSAAWLGQNIFRLRRDSDDAEMNFAADATTGDAPVADITAWLAGANGFLRTWYDQSGSGFNFVNAVSAGQALYVADLGGSGRPGFKDNAGGNSALLCSDSISIPAGYSCLMFGAIGEDGANLGVNTEFEQTDPQAQWTTNFNGVEAGVSVVYGGDMIHEYIDPLLSTTELKVIDYGVAFGVGTLYINGVSQTLVNSDSGVAPGSFTSDSFTADLGATGASEMMFYATLKNAAAREPGRTNMMTYYDQ